MKKYNKIIATLAIITTMTASIAGISAFAGTNNLGSGSDISFDVEVEVNEPDEPNKTITINLENTHSTETAKVQGTKTWVDNDNQDGLRPDSITVHLYADGEDTGLTATASEETNWTYKFTDLAKYSDGELIEYTIKEDVPSGYSVEYVTE